MMILSLARAALGLLAAAFLPLAAYLAWTWYQGAWVEDPAGNVLRVREDWRLWFAAALLAWSLLGRFLIPLVVAGGGGRPSVAARGEGRLVQTASGATLYVEEHGPADAPAIVFTHGWGMDSTFWNYAKQDLADRFRVVVWDLPGLGRSTRHPDGKVSIPRFAADLSDLLDNLDRRVVLVGHSIGGITIQTLVRDYPDALRRVDGVVLLNTTYTNPLRTMVLSSLLTALQKPLLEPMMRLTILASPLVWLSKWQSYLSGSTHLGMRLGFGKTVTRSQLNHAALLATRAQPAVEAHGDLAMLHWDATGAMTQCRAPVLILGGDVDIVTKLEASRAIAIRVPNVRLIIAPGANHMGPMESAELYNAEIAAFTLSVAPDQAASGDPVRPRSGVNAAA